MPSAETLKNKKKGGGFLNRQVAKTKKDHHVSEEQLLQKDKVTPEDVTRLAKATEGNNFSFLFHLQVSNIGVCLAS